MGIPLSLLILLAVATVLAEGQSCVLPPYPLRGHYSVASEPDAVPGKAFDSVFFTSTCDPGYHVEGSNYAFCSQGFWVNEVPQCQHCGNAKPEEKIGTNEVDIRKETPWHAIMYYARSKPANKQICSGTLISSSTVISAAQCVVWDERQGTVPAHWLFIVTGSRYRSWNATDPDAQTRQVKTIKVPLRYNGNKNNDQDDVAILIVSTPYESTPVVKPVCIDFDMAMDRRQLKNGNLGKMSVWEGNDMDTGYSYSIATVTAVDIEVCFAQASTFFTDLLTSDKTCGRFEKGALVRPHNRGAGAVFPEVIDGETYYYLRGVLSISPLDGIKPGTPNTTSWVALTRLQKHDFFIQRNIIY